MYAQIDAKTVGRRIYSFRRKARLTQEKLAEEVGVSPEFIGNIERGVSTPSILTLFRITLALDITFNDLIDKSVAIWTDEDKPCTLREPQSIYCNTLSDWLGLMDDSDTGARVGDLSQLSQIGFRLLGEDLDDEDDEQDDDDRADSEPPEA